MWLYSRDWHIINQLNCSKNKTDNNNNKKPQTSQKPHNSHLLGCTFFFSWHLVASSWGQDLCQSHCYTDESPGQCQGLKDFYENVWIEQVNGWVIEKSKGILGKNRQPPRRPGEQEVTDQLLEKGMATTVYSSLENPMNSVKRQKGNDTERWTPQVGRCPIHYGRRVEK